MTSVYVAKKLKQTEQMQTGSIHNLTRDQLLMIYGKLNNNDKSSLCQSSKELLRARCSGLRRFECSVPSLLAVVLPASPKLLSFSSYVPIGNYEMRLLAYSCPELEVLVLGPQRDLVPPPVDFDDIGLAELAICTNLERVNLSGRRRVGDLGVVTLVRSAKKLQMLTLDRCMNVTDESARAIGELTDLEFLSLEECSLITDNGIVAICQSRNLCKLDICGLPLVTDVSLVEMSRNCHFLSSLRLNGCVGITGEGFRTLINCVCITELEVVNCRGITWEDVEVVASGLHVLENLVLDRRIVVPMKEADLEEHWRFGEANFVSVIRIWFIDGKIEINQDH